MARGASRPARLTIDFDSVSYQKGIALFRRDNMMLKLLKSSHSVGEANMHLQFTPKYRKPVFEDAELMLACEHIFYGIAERLHVQLAGIGFGPNHMHAFITGCKNYSTAELARRFKGASSRVLRENYAERIKAAGLYGDSFWTDGYFYRTVGAVTAETMQRYVSESQKKHWYAEEQRTVQTTLLRFNN
jgi:putative transposase